MKVKIIKRTKKSTANRYFEPGAILDVSEKYGERLIAEGNAVKVNPVDGFGQVLERKFEDLIKEIQRTNNEQE